MESEENAETPDPYTPEPNSVVIEAGTPSLEHTAFVLLGVLLMVLVFVRTAMIALGS